VLETCLFQVHTRRVQKGEQVGEVFDFDWFLIGQTAGSLQTTGASIKSSLRFTALRSFNDVDVEMVACDAGDDGDGDSDGDDDEMMSRNMDECGKIKCHGSDSALEHKSLWSY
jgi:hypothetical protein